MFFGQGDRSQGLGFSTERVRCACERHLQKEGTKSKVAGLSGRLRTDCDTFLGMASTPVLNPLLTTSIVPRLGPLGPSQSFADILTSIAASTDTIQSELERRESGGSLQEGGRSGSRAGNTTITMPECPPNGPLGFVYGDLFDQAKENLAQLNRNYPPGDATGEQKKTWVTLIARNKFILQSATNIAREYLFPAGNGAPEAMQSLTATMPSPDKAGWPVAKGGGAPITAVRALATLPLRIVQQIYVNDRSTYDAVKRAVIRTAPDRIDAELNSPDLSVQQNAMIRYLTPYRDGVPLVASTLNADNRTLQSALPEGAWDYNGLFAYQQDVTVVTGTNEITGETSRRTDRYTYYVSSSMLMAAYRDVAREYSRLELRTMLLESYSFYAFNALVYFADILGLTREQIREQQTNAVRAQTATSTGTMTAVATLANPIFGVIAGALAALVDQLVAAIGAADGNVFSTPFSLFRRIPRADCPPLPENIVRDEIIGPSTPAVDAPCVPACTAGNTCVSGTCRPSTTTKKSASVAGPVVVGASLLFLYSLLRGR